MSKYYTATRKKQEDYKIAEAAHNLKSAYSAAKSKATKLEKEGDIAMAERIRQMVDESKQGLSNSDYTYYDINWELERFKHGIEILTK